MLHLMFFSVLSLRKTLTFIAYGKEWKQTKANGSKGRHEGEEGTEGSCEVWQGRKALQVQVA